MLPASLALLLSVSTAFADPQSPDTLVLPNGSEISGLPFLHNWTSPEAARSLRWPTCKPSSSAMARPTAITLHETGAPNPDFGDPTGKKRCVHFMVQRDGTILQIARPTSHFRPGRCSRSTTPRWPVRERWPSRSRARSTSAAGRVGAQGWPPEQGPANLDSKGAAEARAAPANPAMMSQRHP